MAVLETRINNLKPDSKPPPLSMEEAKKTSEESPISPTVIEKFAAKMGYVKLEDVKLPTALRENTYMFIAITMIIVGALWKLVDWSVILSIEFGIFTLVFSGWIKKWREAALIQSKAMLGVKDDEILKLKTQVSEFFTKNKILEDIIGKLSPSLEIVKNAVVGTLQTLDKK